MQNLLDQLLVLHANTRQFHWTGVGKGFISLHKFLDELYDFVDEYIDTLAERMRALRLWPDGTIHRRIETAFELQGQSGPIEYADGVKHLVAQLQYIAKLLEALIKQKEDDLATQDIFIEGLREVEKFAWLLRMETFES